MLLSVWTERKLSMRMRLLSRLKRSKLGTGTLLLPASLNSWAAAVLRRVFETRRERMWRKAPVCKVLDGCCISFHHDYPVKRTCIYEVR